MPKEADLSCEIDETCAPASLWMRNVQQGIFAIPQAAYLLWLYLLWSLFAPPQGPRCTTYCGYTYCGSTYYGYTYCGYTYCGSTYYGYNHCGYVLWLYLLWLYLLWLY